MRGRFEDRGGMTDRTGIIEASSNPAKAFLLPVMAPYVYEVNVDDMCVALVGWWEGEGEGHDGWALLLASSLLARHDVYFTLCSAVQGASRQVKSSRSLILILARKESGGQIRFCSLSQQPQPPSTTTPSSLGLGR